MRTLAVLAVLSGLGSATSLFADEIAPAVIGAPVLPGYRFARAEASRVAAKVPNRLGLPAPVRPSIKTPVISFPDDVQRASYQTAVPANRTAVAPLPVVKPIAEKPLSPVGATTWQRWGDWKPN